LFGILASFSFRKGLLKKFPIDIYHLSGDIIALEAPDIFTAAGDALLTSGGSTEHLLHRCCQPLGIVGIHIQRVRASGFL
jgi:hypothetical protein